MPLRRRVGSPNYRRIIVVAHDTATVLVSLVNPNDKVRYER